MPREIVTNSEMRHHEHVTVTEWVDLHYDALNYTSNRIAVYEKIGEKQKEDYTYKVKHVLHDYRDTRIRNTSDVILLGVPIVLDAKASWLKKHDDELFCRARTGNASEPDWSHCVHADYTRAGDFLFSATRHGESFKKQISVAISVIETMRFYCDHVSEVRDLSQRIFDMPQLSDSMQKYISCIVLDMEYSPSELLTMIKTTINRNRKWSADDLSSTSALLILLPMVKQLFNRTRVFGVEDSACSASANRQQQVTRLLRDYSLRMSCLDMTVKYALASPSSNHRQNNHDHLARHHKDIVIINPAWIDLVCKLATSFGVPNTYVDILRLDLTKESISIPHSTIGRLIMKFDLPNDHISWVRDRSRDMRVVKRGQGFRADGLSQHTKCQLTLVPSLLTSTQSYQLDLAGGGTVSVTPDSQSMDVRKMLTTSPIIIRLDQKNNTCVVNQGHIQFSFSCKRLTIMFSGVYLSVTPIRPSGSDDSCASASDVADICGVCLDDTESSDVKYITDCRHTFHRQCIDAWMDHCSSTYVQATCPMCRTAM